MYEGNPNIRQMAISFYFGCSSKNNKQSGWERIKLIDFARHFKVESKLQSIKPVAKIAFRDFTADNADGSYTASSELAWILDEIDPVILRLWKCLYILVNVNRKSSFRRHCFDVCNFVDVCVGFILAISICIWLLTCSTCTTFTNVHVVGILLET